MKVTFQLNGREIMVDVNSGKRLADLLHDDLKVKSVRASCYRGLCGNCTVIINDTAQLSCLIPAFTVHGKSILTLEGFEETSEYEEMMTIFGRHNYTPCSYCFPGKMLAIHALLLQNLNPSKGEILEALWGNRCSCDVYAPLIESVYTAAHLRRRGSHV